MTALDQPQKFIAYYRVSTDKQGHSKLGLEAQQAAVRLFLANRAGAELLFEYTEVESGKKKNRPELSAALWQCKRQKATLVIAKLDRLARNVHFVSGLMESGVDFVATDNPHANRLMVHMLAAFAEHERDLISQRTKEGLQAAKARGTKLGENGKTLAAQNKAASAAHIENIAPLIEAIPYEERNTVTKLTDALNRYGVPTMKGGRWHRQGVYRTMSYWAPYEQSPTDLQ
jgi:DNA invertase Pin-like site-specific DNA recombinase